MSSKKRIVNLAVAIATLAGSSAQAAEANWMQSFKDGVKAYKNGSKDEASKCFSKAQEVATARGTDALAQCLGRIGIFYAQRKSFDDAEKYLKLSLDTREKKYGAKSDKLAGALLNLGLFYKKAGKYKEALPLYERFIALKRKSVQEDKLDLVIDLKLLSDLYGDAGQKDKALAIDSEISQLLSDATKDTGGSEALVEKVMKAGDLSLGELILKRQLKEEKAKSPDSLEVAKRLRDIARFYEKTGLFEEALPYWEKFIAIYEKRDKGDDLEVAEAYSSLERASEGKQKEHLKERMMRIYSKIPKGSKERLHLAVIYNNEAMLSDSPKEGDELYKKAIAICDEVKDKLESPEEQMVVVVIYRGYANLLRGQKRIDEAKKWDQKAETLAVPKAESAEETD